MSQDDHTHREEGAAAYAAPSLASVALRSCCPRCGRGPLFSGFLNTRERCSSCGLDFRFIDSGDGPAFFIMLLVGAVVVAAALVTEVLYEPPYWVHLVLWLPMILILSFGLLRPAKALMIGLQYRNKAAESRFEAPGSEEPR